ncbi:hypothetical protein C362_04264 [Cryptococcus neoformans Bt1]|nr:hypothetical protein C362_04264 [Cryptococcus neoformans var. grubii Bt1]
MAREVGKMERKGWRWRIQGADGEEFASVVW